MLVPSETAALQVYVVNTTDDIADKQGCTTVHCSLREAIAAANKNKGLDSIHFNIAGDLTHTIRPTSALPAVTDPVVIDGTTEPGFATMGRPVVELDGSLAPPSAVGLRVSGGASTIRGLIINRFGSSGSSTGGASGIVLETKGSNLVVGNYIGTDPTGHSARGNRLAGIAIYRSSNNVIGGTTPGSRNVLSGNGTGIGIDRASGNRVVGNYIGVDAEGDNPLGNEAGVHIGEAANNVVGGRAAGEGNVISANAGAGVAIDGQASQGNRIEGNAIGTDLAGTADFGNFWGVRVGTGAISNVIGGDQQGAGNTIAFNRHSGAFIIDDNVAPRALRISVWGNSIHTNGIAPFPGLGIELSPEGVNPNDPLDRDLGANRKMNYPVLTSAVGSLTTDVTGTLNSEPERSYRIEIFSNPTCDPSGYGEGKHYLGAIETTTDASGNAQFSLSSPVSTPPGWFVTATSTEMRFRNGSEFGECLEVDEPPDPASWIVNQVSDEVDAYGCTVSHCTFREAVQRANAVSGRDTISFDIAAEVDEAPHLIAPLTGLPPLSESVIIDAATEPDFAGEPVVRLDGINSPAGAIGLDVRGGQSIIRGLSITRWTGAQIALASDANLVAGNWIGITPEGQPARTDAVGVRVTGADNDIGGVTDVERNLIAHHDRSQVHITGSLATGNVILGNWVGVLPNGLPAVPEVHSLHGILIDGGADSNVIGIAQEGGGNRLTSTAYDTVELRNVSYTVLHNNEIGATADRPYPATRCGNHCIRIDGGAGTLIGGTGPLEANTIGGTAGAGVLVTGGTGHTIIGNSISAGEISIDLGTFHDSVTLNDPGDADVGPNGLQNYPFLGSATRFGSTVVINGTLDTHPDQSYRIDFYANYQPHDHYAECQGSQSRQIGGQQYRFGQLTQWLGSQIVQTDASGTATIDFTTPPDAVGPNAFIVATAMAPDGSTSEGGPCTKVVDGDFVQADGTALTLAGEPYTFGGMNIYNINNRVPYCWYEMYESRLNLSLSQLGAGVDAVRGWFFQDFATTNGQRDWSAFDLTIARAKAHGMKVIVTLGNQLGDCDSEGFKTADWYAVGYTQQGPGLPASYRDFVSEVVERYKDEPAVLMWQLLNEAEVPLFTPDGLCNEAVAHPLLKNWATDMSGLIKSIDVNHLVSIGTIGSGQCGAQFTDYQSLHDIPTVDLCEFHDYGTEVMPGDQFNGLAFRLQQCNELDKPLFVGETGIIPEWLDGTLAARAALFDQKFEAQLGAGVVGEVVWAWNLFESRTDTFDIGPGDPTLGVLADWFPADSP